jgi:hypothetical protein
MENAINSGRDSVASVLPGDAEIPRSNSKFPKLKMR